MARIIRGVDYEAYLKSPRWKKLKRVLCPRGSACTACDKKRCLQLHHISYKNLGYEESDDLIPVCEPCHKAIHAFLDAKYPRDTKAFRCKQTCVAFLELFQKNMAHARGEYGWYKKWLVLHPPRIQKPPKAAKKKGRRRKTGKSIRGTWRKRRDEQRDLAERKQRLKELDEKFDWALANPVEAAIMAMPTLEERVRARIAARQLATSR